MSAALPPLYAGWMDTLLGAPIPVETGVICDRCVMCDPEGTVAPHDRYNPATKCCTFTPELFNFLVGRILDDDDPAAQAGRATVEARLRAGVAVTPFSLGCPRPFATLYKLGGERTFGRSRALRCPHYLEVEGGNCGVWKHRMSTCATWYCRHERGATGQHFWRSIHRLLGAVERALAAHCVLALDPGREAMELIAPMRANADPPLEPEELDGCADPERYRKLWGRWHGREAEFYRACAGIVGALDWPAVQALCGPDVAYAAHLARAAFAERMVDVLPERLTLGSFSMTAVDAATVALAGYKRTDPLLLPRSIANTLHRFAGQPTREAMQRIEDEDRLALDDELVCRLADFGILTEP
jgi:hypothetical protein